MAKRIKRNKKIVVDDQNLTATEEVISEEKNRLADNADEKPIESQTNEEEKLDFDGEFAIRQSFNTVIDSELNRIWGYLKLKDERDRKASEFLTKIDSIIKDIEELKKISKSLVAEQKGTSLDSKVQAIVNKMNSDLFSEATFRELLADEIKREIKRIPEIKVLFEGESLSKARFELGYAEKDSVVYFGRAFSKIVWSQPSKLALLTNTGFIAQEDAFYMIVGID